VAIRTLGDGGRRPKRIDGTFVARRWPILAAGGGAARLLRWRRSVTIVPALYSMRRSAPALRHHRCHSSREGQVTCRILEERRAVQLERGQPSITMLAICPGSTLCGFAPRWVGSCGRLLDKRMPSEGWTVEPLGLPPLRNEHAGSKSDDPSVARPGLRIVRVKRNQQPRRLAPSHSRVHGVSIGRSVVGRAPIVACFSVLFSSSHIRRNKNGILISVAPRSSLAQRYTSNENEDCTERRYLVFRSLGEVLSGGGPARAALVVTLWRQRKSIAPTGHNGQAARPLFERQGAQQSRLGFTSGGLRLGMGSTQSKNHAAARARASSGRFPDRLSSGPRVVASHASATLSEKSRRRRVTMRPELTLRSHRSMLESGCPGSNHQTLCVRGHVSVVRP